MTALGIDLGTTFSCVFTHAEGDLVAVEVFHGSRIFRSAVLIENGKWYLKRPDDVPGGQRIHVSLAKRLIGRTGCDGQLVEDASLVEHSQTSATGGFYAISGDIILPEEVSAFILGRIRKKVSDIELIGCVLAVPAYFTFLQREATKDAAQIAGFDRSEVTLVPEPVAALVSFIFDKRAPTDTSLDGYWFVIDIGGGTADVTIADVDGTEKTFVVVATAGDNALGGIHFDEELRCLVLNKINSDNPGAGLNIDNCDMTLVTSACERAQEELSETTETEVRIRSMTGDSFTTTVTRQEAEQAWKESGGQIAPLERIKDLFARALEAPNVANIGQIPNVLIAGGVGNMPCVRSLINNVLPSARIHLSHLSEAIGRGAAYISNDPDILITEVTPRGIGISMNEDEMGFVVHRNQAVPASSEEVFCTPCDNAEKIDIIVFEGDHLTASKNIELGRFVIRDIPPCPAGTRINVTVDVPELGSFNVSACVVIMETEESLRVEHAPRHTPDELERLSQVTLARLEGIVPTSRVLATTSAEQQGSTVGSKRAWSISGEGPLEDLGTKRAHHWNGNEDDAIDGL
ncbi:heat shock cognate HSP70 protein [Colletotrichum sp. SAR11_59]|nr:heat shock cognate HSP70 protein [Colletotrichum sp. SAR11_59]